MKSIGVLKFGKTPGVHYAAPNDGGGSGGGPRIEYFDQKPIKVTLTESVVVTDRGGRIKPDGKKD